jgi:hypothetical protein
MTYIKTLWQAYVKIGVMINRDEFWTIDFQSPTVILVTLIFVILSASCVLVIVFLTNIWVSIMLLIPTSIFPLFLIMALTSRIKLGQDYIERKSFFWSKRIQLEEIKSFGVYQQSLYSLPRLLDHEHADKKGGVIFLSTSDIFDLDSSRPKNHVRFPFRAETYEAIREWLKKASTPQKV